MFHHNSIIPWRSFRGRQEEKWGSFRGWDHFRVGDHFGVGIISGAVQYYFSFNQLQNYINGLPLLLGLTPGLPLHLFLLRPLLQTEDNEHAILM